MIAWFLLVGAIVSEVVATTSLKLSDGFSKLVPSIFVVVGYIISFWMIAVAMKTIPLTIAYPIWAGLGTALVVISGLLVFRETLTPAKVIGIIVVVIGIIILNLSGAHRFE